ncbi:hypothetical protein ALO_16766 [Acetonema longum DSM 6540]|uniref:Uncharacterized protein n=1 Tax=Acetonema longum DSM 6540 TaxID=1009370 RepID=F7NMM2_9FIRM|nr:hypothetical protein ALO_16766 [Acetonema longum DSM 6540]
MCALLFQFGLAVVKNLTFQKQKNGLTGANFVILCLNLFP